MTKKKLINEMPEEVYFGEQPTEVLDKEKENGEKVKKISEEEIQKLREEIEKTDLDSELKIQAEIQAQDVKSLKESGKIKKLLEITKNKGVIYAVNVAKNMDDAYILDTLHDTLAKEGYYKKFMK